MQTIYSLCIPSETYNLVKENNNNIIQKNTGEIQSYDCVCITGVENRPECSFGNITLVESSAARACIIQEYDDIDCRWEIIRNLFPLDWAGGPQAILGYNF